MTYLLISESGIFRKAEFVDEKELENVVIDNYGIIFGDYSIYIPQKTVSTSGGHSTRPEAIVLNFKDGVWYVVEVELANHGVWEHIVPQITKQLVAVENSEMKTKLIDLFTEKVKESNELKGKFNELGISELDIRETIEKIIGKSPTLVIPIDKVPADLKYWAQAIKNEVIILEIEKYVNEQTQEVIYRIPEYMRSPPLEEAEVTIKKKITREEFLAKCSEPARILFNKLEEIARERKNYVKLEPRGTSFSFKVRVGSKEWVLLTLYPEGVSIQKYNLTPEKGLNADAIEAFAEQIKKIGQLAERYDTMKQPGFSIKPTDISIDDINVFVNAVKDLVDSIETQNQ